MARSNEASQSQLPVGPDQQGWRHFGDGLAGKLTAARIQAYDSSTLSYVDVAVDSAGQLKTTSSSGGGGPVTVADGADVAQGTTSDVAWASGSGTVISLLKKIASAGGSAVSIADGADVAQGATTDNSSALTIVGLLKNIKAALAGALTTNATLSAETTKVIGTVNQGTSPWVVGSHAVTNAGTFAVQQTKPTTGTTSSPASVTTVVATVLAANAARYGATAFNESGAICYLKLGSAAALTDYTLQVAIGGYYEVPFAYTGIITGITSTGTAVLRVTEIT